MKKFKLKTGTKKSVLALGAESAGNFSLYKNGEIFMSEDFGDLLLDANFQKYSRALNKFLADNRIKPDVILSDLHPLFHTTLLAQELAKKYKAKYIPVQHHLAHVFSAIGDRILQDTRYKIQDTNIGIACDGTGFGFDEKIWGGEVFKISNFQFFASSLSSGLISNQFPNSNLAYRQAGFQIPKKNTGVQIERMAHLENQILLGGEMAIKEPARMLISILSKFSKKSEVQRHLKKHYTENEFEVLWNQLEQNFNCLETSSTARVLDAVSVLLGFSKNERLSKHGPIELLEKNSTKPYPDLKPKIITQRDIESGIMNHELCTTYLFEYLIRNLHKDKKRLAATAQKYIADGLWEIIQNLEPKTENLTPVYFSGGIANNKIISEILESKGVYTNKKISRGDAGLSFGQIFYYLLSK